MTRTKVKSFNDLLTDDQKLVREMMFNNWQVEKKLLWLEAKGYKIGEDQFYKQVRIIKSKRDKRLDYFAQYGLSEIHLELLDQLHILLDKLWDLFYTERDSIKRLAVQKELRETILWVASFADATQDVREKEMRAREIAYDTERSKIFT